MGRDRAQANAFYSSRAWRTVRESYRRQVGGLCERCLERGLIEPGEIVHHVTHLDDDNVHDPVIALDAGNLQLLCRRCHAEVHGTGKRYTVDQYGNVTANENLK